MDELPPVEGNGRPSSLAPHTPPNAAAESTGALKSRCAEGQASAPEPLETRPRRCATHSAHTAQHPAEHAEPTLGRCYHTPPNVGARRRRTVDGEERFLLPGCPSPAAGGCWTKSSHSPRTCAVSGYQPHRRPPGSLAADPQVRSPAAGTLPPCPTWSSQRPSSPAFSRTPVATLSGDVVLPTPAM